MKQRDWQPLLHSFKHAVDNAIDLAVARSLEFPAYVGSFERVRTFAHAWLDGRRAAVATDDLLVTIGAILCEIELDLGIDSAALLTPLVNAPSDKLHIAGTPRVFTKRASRARRAGTAKIRVHHQPMRPRAFPM